MTGSTSVAYIKGIGSRKAAILEAAGIVTIEDLCNHFPRRYIDRTTIRPIARLHDKETITVVGTIRTTQHEGNNTRFKIMLDDGTGKLELTWFRNVRYFARIFQTGDVLAVHGKVSYYGHQPQMQHPEYDILSPDRRDTTDTGNSDLDHFNTGKIIPLYPVTDAMKQAGITSRQLRILIARAMQNWQPGRTENLPEAICSHYRLMPLDQSYSELHAPTTTQRLDAARHRMKWTELFYAQLLFAIRHSAMHHNKAARVVSASGAFTRQLHEQLPFELTEAQKNAIRDIYRDLRSGTPMNRLLQGDVGSGKTIVALFAMALAADNGLQSAFMAPTEILAVQHYIAMKRYFEPLGLHVALLTGKQRKKERQQQLQALADGHCQLAIGTHAMLETGVTFATLGLIIIDEQHRFGVLQRKALREKADNPHVLLMTATPIPRTLTMGMFGDLDLTVIRQMPAGRQPVTTIVRPQHDKQAIYTRILAEISSGHQAYIVYPLVEESEKLDLQAAVESYQALSTGPFASIRCGLINGQMTPDEKESVMSSFRNHQTDLLVGTTVIEVGVDVPNATIMLIEHAERFGLAQLHQLRGRVGRGKHPSYCCLLYAKYGTDARQRLEAMASTNDGFLIAELDARIRGTGNILGKEQSGTITGLRIADLDTDGDIMQQAREAAFRLISQDAQLRAPANAPVRDYYLRHGHQRIMLAEIG